MHGLQKSVPITNKTVKYLYTSPIQVTSFIWLPKFPALKNLKTTRTWYHKKGNIIFIVPLEVTKHRMS